jgi:uncharacterized protein with PIN domain
MADEKDRFGEKLHDKAKVHADQWARQQDAELLEKIRNKAAAAMHCPKCNSALVDKVHAGIHLQACPKNDGAWIDALALENLLRK